MIPAGSHVVLGGTADGNLLYKYLHDQPHPIGATTTITYKQVYQYLSCLGVSPCEGWMNDNDTVRELTTARNMAYDKVYQDLVSSSNKGANYTNFDLIYLTSPLLDILTDWDAEGKNPAELIEPVDGFHPGQIAQALEAKWMYEHLEEAYPEFLGEVNPHNDDIQKVFGDQGGY
uniref:Uncharacterized protein n=3 Tax=Palpitomonas bilix TaxID=652834 RepID=A0A7S3CVG2_9EUKA|mmetsp:Transcript_10827/g.28418  ORF Transcript_10827/g.28418 Transcript_10827/m.28418 type:complete len:174 (+) Transcript_10827:167-688(+)